MADGPVGAPVYPAEMQSELKQIGKNRVFRKMFGLPESETLIDDWSCAILKGILLQGRLYVSENFVCFYSSIFSHRTQIVLPVTEISAVSRATILMIPNSIKIFAQREYFFASFIFREETYATLKRVCRAAKSPSLSRGLGSAGNDGTYAENPPKKNDIDRALHDLATDDPFVVVSDSASDTAKYYQTKHEITTRERARSFDSPDKPNLTPCSNKRSSSVQKPEADLALEAVEARSHVSRSSIVLQPVSASEPTTPNAQRKRYPSTKKTSSPSSTITKRRKNLFQARQSTKPTSHTLKDATNIEHEKQNVKVAETTASVDPVVVRSQTEEFEFGEHTNTHTYHHHHYRCTHSTSVIQACSYLLLLYIFL